MTFMTKHLEMLNFARIRVDFTSNAKNSIFSLIFIFSIFYEMAHCISIIFIKNIKKHRSFIKILSTQKNFHFACENLCRKLEKMFVSEAFL